MKYLTRGFQTALMLLMTLCLFGCGSTFSQGKGSATNGNGTPTGTPIPPSITPTSGTTSSSSGQVTLTMSKQQYTSEDPLLLTIHNGLQSSIWVLGQQATCLSLTVQRLDNGAWETASNCIPAQAPKPVAIASGASTTWRIDYVQGMDTGASWPAGTYRVTLHYTLSASASQDSGTTIQSATFAIQ
jgi:hypothetical protein